MMKSIRKTAMMVALAAMATTSAWAATDYSSMTTEELGKIRGTLQDASQEERDVFRAEWRQRIQTMTPVERQQYMGRPSGAAAAGTGMQQGMGQGRGKGGQGRGMGRVAQ